MTLQTRSIFSLFLLVACIFSCQQTDQEPVQNQHSQPIDNETLVTKYGADEYGMKQYVMAFLKRGPNRSQDSARAAALQTAHMENIGRMAEAGKLVLAGPFLDTGELRGIYIFNVTTVEEAQELTATDPAIQAGSLAMELKP